MTGAPAEGMQAHHSLPQKFRPIFEKMGINIDNPKYGRWLESTKHNKGSYKYNKKWEQYFIGNQHASEEEIIDQINVFMKEVYGE